MYEHACDVCKTTLISSKRPQFVAARCWLDQLRICCSNKIKTAEAQMQGCQCAICDVLRGKSTEINGDQIFWDGKSCLTEAVEHKFQERIASMYGFTCKKKRILTGRSPVNWSRIRLKKSNPPTLESRNNVRLFCEPKCKCVQTFQLCHQGCRVIPGDSPGCEVLL